MFTIRMSAASRRRLPAPFIVALAALSGCSGAPPSTPMPLTVTTSDAPGTLVRGQQAVFTFTVTNPSSSDVTDAVLTTDSRIVVGPGVLPMQLQGVTCAAQHATCPSVSTDGQSGPFTLPAGGVLTFTVTALVGIDYDGVVDQQIEITAMERHGKATAAAHATLANASAGYYELFTTAGKRDNLDVGMKAGATKFATAPYQAAQSTFVRHASGYVFPSGLIFNTATDLLVGQADFGDGPETFIGARQMVVATADLDGVSFTTLGVSSPDGAAAVGTVRTMAISGTSMDVCTDASHTVATCPGAALRHYALTQSPLGGPVFTAIDSADNDSFDFQVARSGDALILLQADRLAGGGVFAVGFANPTPPADGYLAIGNLGGSHVVVEFKPGSFLVTPVDLETLIQSREPQAALSAVPGGPAGLLAGTRPSDGAALLMLQQAGLVLVSGPAGEFDVLGPLH